ncbi:unnamed protein product, partial [Brenthis ino]
MKYFIVLLGFVAVAYGQTNVHRCVGTAGPLPTRTTIEGCTNPPCDLPQLRNAVIHMSFTAPRNIRTMRTLATAFLGAVPVPYNLGDAANTCNFLTNTRCPVNNGVNVDYTLRMFIESFFPVGTAVTVEMRVVDENNNSVVCVRVPIRIVRG